MRIPKLFPALHRREVSSIAADPDAGWPSTSWQPLFLIFAADLLVKAAILSVDSTPRLFIGDSLSYLYTSLTGWIPPDRSFVYGFFLRIFAVWPHSLQILVWCQAVLSALSAWLVAVCLVRYLQTSLPVAAFCSLLCAFEPLQLLAERYVLTEVVTTLVFAIFVLFCFSYLTAGSLVALVLVQLCGVLLISLRISFLPTVVICSFALPFFARPVSLGPVTCRVRDLSRFHVSRGHRSLRSLATLVALGLLLSQALLFGYRHLYGHLITAPLHGHPAYLYSEGLFLISDFAPLLKPIDYPIPGQRSVLFRPSRVPLDPPENRDAQRWYPDGICDRILRECHGDEQAADDLARRTAVHALKRDPIAAIQLVMRTAFLYFDRTYFVETLRVDEGHYRSLAAAEAATYRQRFSYDFPQAAAHIDKFPPLTERWHQASYVWYWFLLLWPFLFTAALCVYRRFTLPADWLCALFLFLFFAGAVVTVTRPTARFLTTMAWLACITLGAGYSRYAAHRKNVTKP